MNLRQQENTDNIMEYQYQVDLVCEIIDSMTDNQIVVKYFDISGNSKMNNYQKVNLITHSNLLYKILLGVEFRFGGNKYHNLISNTHRRLRELDDYTPEAIFAKLYFPAEIEAINIINNLSPQVNHIKHIRDIKELDYIISQTNSYRVITHCFGPRFQDKIVNLHKKSYDLYIDYRDLKNRCITLYLPSDDLYNLLIDESVIIGIRVGIFRFNIENNHLTEKDYLLIYKNQNLESIIRGLAMLKLADETIFEDNISSEDLILSGLAVHKLKRINHL